MKSENPVPPLTLVRRAARIALWALVTTLVTLVLMALSALTGGFAATSSAASGDMTAIRWSVPIVIHLVTVIAALGLGAAIFLLPKGTARHRLMGRVYCVCLLITAVASFWIGRPGTGIGGSGFSFIHLFSVWTLITIPMAVVAVRHGRADKHESMMRGLYIGLVLAGLFSFLPGRLLGNLVF